MTDGYDDPNNVMNWSKERVMEAAEKRWGHLGHPILELHVLDSIDHGNQTQSGIPFLLGLQLKDTDGPGFVTIGCAYECFGFTLDNAEENGEARIAEAYKRHAEMMRRIAEAK